MKKTYFLLLLMIHYLSGIAQGTVQDYKNAYNFWQSTSGKVYYSDIRPTWIGNTNTFWYIRTTPEGREYIQVYADKRKKTALFDAIKLSDALSSQCEKKTSAENLNLANLKVTDNADSLFFIYENFEWNYSLKDNKLTKVKGIDPNNRQNRRRGGGYWGTWNGNRREYATASPDKKWEAFSRDNNIVLRNIESKEETILTKDGSNNNYYSAYILWSPDSKHFAVMQTQPPQQHLLTLIESSPKDQLQPKIHTRDYLKPGDTVAVNIPNIFNVETKTQLKADDALFKDAYETQRIQWNKNGKAITFEYNQRGHQVYRILEMDAETGNIRIVLEETSKTFINYNRYFRQDLKDGKEFIWMSERDNWNHLYLYDYSTGKVKNQITKGEWYVRDILNVDEEKKQITFTANGINKDEDPYFIHYYRINFNGTGLVKLTEGAGTHTALFSNNNRYIIDTYSSANIPPVTVLRDGKNGKLLMELEKADISELLKSGWQMPEPFVAKGRDGETDIWGIIRRPRNFDPSKKYPIIEYIYAGPGSHYVPKAFSVNDWNLCDMAELGFIMVQIDGMGTSFRSKAFEEIVYKNLKDGGFEDRILWIKAAAQKYPYMDINRVGIYGCSAGGQNALGALLFHPEFYKVGYAACGCHDNRMDKIWWNEQWMGKMGPHYAECSNTENAYKLQGKLMLVVGEMDDNVDPSSSFQVVNALIKANKDFEFIYLPGVGHSMGENFGTHKRYDFFVKHLLGVNPPEWDELK